MLVILLLLLPLALADFPFRNISLSWKERVDDLVSRLTLDEMRLQMTRGGVGPKAGPAPAIPRLGIKPYSWDTICLGGDARAGDATSFPAGIGLGASFSTDLLFRVSKAVGEEVRAKFNNYTSRGQYGDYKGISCFSPIVNIARDPRWGRNQETFGEDPCLTGTLATHYIKGLQGSHPRYVRANAGCNYFDAYAGPENIPVAKTNFSAQISERDLRTTYLPAFHACVKAGTYNFMCSYNSVNGIPSCANKKLLTDILRNEWGFEGYVVTDEAAVELIISAHHYLNNSIDTAAACINAGVNVELSDNLEKPVFYSMVDAINQGKLTEDLVRSRVKDLFNTRMRLGEFDPPGMNPYTKLNISVVQSEAHRNLSIEATLKSFVLLKNVNNVLPLKKDDYKNVVVTGPMANDTMQMFPEYTSEMNPVYTTNPLQALKSLWPELAYAAGCTDNNCTNYNSHQVKAAVTASDIVFVCLGTGTEIETEGHDKVDLELPVTQRQLLEDAVNYSAGGDAKIVLLLFNAGPLNITWAANHPRVHVILEVFFPGQSAGEAIRRMIQAEGPNSVPAGRLPMTWPKYRHDIPAITNYSMQGRTYRYFEKETLFPFGYGLSYTTFEYVAMTYTYLLRAGEDAQGTVTVRNTGDIGADEVIQIYLSWEASSVPSPHIQLVNFYRQYIPANTQTSLNFTIPAETMAVWINEDKGWVIEPGRINFWIGGQQPMSRPEVGSNILNGVLVITGSG